MTALLEQALSELRERPESDQDEAALLLFALLSKGAEPVQLDEQTRLAIREGLAQARRGEFVSDDDMAEFFKRHGA
jgi:predicted transcriptional regulator